MCLAIPGEVLSLEPNQTGLLHGVVNFGGIRKKVCLAYTPDVTIGDYVLVHAGFAIHTIDAHEAARVFRELEAMDVFEELEP